MKQIGIGRLVASLAGLCFAVFFIRTAEAQPLRVTLDWLPSPEYYGFYFAAEAGLYTAEKLDVSIQNASGAPVVAAQLGAGSISIGTTTSDNILRQASRGARFTRLVPLLLFNPVSIVSLPAKPVGKAADLLPLTVGTNPQTSTYAQYEYLLRSNSLPLGVIKEYPIGYGGAAQLLSGEVDAFLAYTTNQAIDVDMRRPDAIEFLFEENGLRTYGLVLAVTASPELPDEIVDRFIRATLNGYKLGGDQVDGSVRALRKAEPLLDAEKVTRSIRKIVSQNARAPSRVPPDLDAWVSVENDKAELRLQLSRLYQAGLSISKNN